MVLYHEKDGDYLGLLTVVSQLVPDIFVTSRIGVFNAIGNSQDSKLYNIVIKEGAGSKGKVLEFIWDVVLHNLIYRVFLR